MKQSRSSRQRAGVTVIVMLVLIAVVTSLLLGGLLRSLDQRREMLLGQRRMQAELLAQAAKERALARLKSNPAYEGETWSLDAKELDGRTAAIEMHLSRDAGLPSKLLIHVRYPAEDRMPLALSQEFEIKP